MYGSQVAHFVGLTQESTRVNGKMGKYGTYSKNRGMIFLFEQKCFEKLCFIGSMYTVYSFHSTKSDSKFDKYDKTLINIAVKNACTISTVSLYVLVRLKFTR